MVSRAVRISKLERERRTEKEMKRERERRQRLGETQVWDQGTKVATHATRTETEQHCLENSSIVQTSWRDGRSTSNNSAWKREREVCGCEITDLKE